MTWTCLVERSLTRRVMPPRASVRRRLGPPETVAPLRRTLARLAGLPSSVTTSNRTAFVGRRRFGLRRDRSLVTILNCLAAPAELACWTATACCTSAPVSSGIGSASLRGGSVSAPTIPPPLNLSELAVGAGAHDGEALVDDGALVQGGIVEVRGEQRLRQRGRQHHERVGDRRRAREGCGDRPEDAADARASHGRLRPRPLRHDRADRDGSSRW